MTTFFLVVPMTCFGSNVTYIHITLQVRTPSVCPNCRTNLRNFHFVLKGPKYLIPLALKFRMPLVLPCSVLNLSHFSWFKHSLFLLMPVCSFSPFSLFFFSFILTLFYLTFFFVLILHLHVQPYLFLSYLMIIFYVLKKLCVLRDKLSCRCQYYIY